MPVRPVSEELVAKTLPLLNRHVRAMVELQRLTGARSGEITRMRGCDLERSGPVWIYRPWSHKNAYRGHAREIYLGPKAQAILQDFLLADPEAYLFSPKAATAERYAVLRQRRKSQLTPSEQNRRKAQPQRQPGAYYPVRSYCHAIGKACQKAGLPRWHPHQLRHSAATQLRKEFGVEVARIILGHRSLAATEIYSELNRDQALAVMQQFG
jgi:integrase